jgi:hypothetical protein
MRITPPLEPSALRQGFWHLRWARAMHGSNLEIILEVFRAQMFSRRDYLAWNSGVEPWRGTLELNG